MFFILGKFLIVLSLFLLTLKNFEQERIIKREQTEIKLLNKIVTDAKDFQFAHVFAFFFLF